MRRWTIEDQGQFRDFPRDEPIWYDCPMLDIPNTMVHSIENMPDNVKAVSLVDAPMYQKNFKAGVEACNKRGVEIVVVDWNTMKRSHTPQCLPPAAALRARAT